MPDHHASHELVRSACIGRRKDDDSKNVRKSRREHHLKSEQASFVNVDSRLVAQDRTSVLFLLSVASLLVVPGASIERGEEAFAKDKQVARSVGAKL